MSEKFLLSLENPNFESYMETVQVKMKEIFSQAYEEDLYSWIFHLSLINFFLFLLNQLCS